MGKVHLSNAKNLCLYSEYSEETGTNNGTLGRDFNETSFATVAKAKC